MESRTPVFLTGVRMGASRIAGRIPCAKYKAGVWHGHQIHSTVTAL